MFVTVLIIVIFQGESKVVSTLLGQRFAIHRGSLQRFAVRRTVVSVPALRIGSPPPPPFPPASSQ